MYFKFWLYNSSYLAISFLNLYFGINEFRIVCRKKTYDKLTLYNNYIVIYYHLTSIKFTYFPSNVEIENFPKSNIFLVILSML